MSRPAEQRLRIGIAVVSVGVLLAFLGNDILSRIDFQTGRWEQPYMFPLVLPVGADFREGLYYPAKILLQGKSPYLDYHSNYPPFTILASVPFRLFDVDTAYFVQVVLLYGLNILAIGMAVRLAASAAVGEGEPSVRRMAGLPLFILVSVLVLTSYGFLFSVERGNYDAYAQFAGIVGLWLIVRKPEKVWLQSLAFSVAVHFKMYPAILFLLLVWRHGRRSLPPLAVINTLLLLCIGPAHAIQFVEVMLSYARRPFLWVGNHSAASFGQLVNGYLGARAGWQAPAIVFYALPTVVWLAGAYLLWRRGFGPASASWFYALSVPMMNVIPSTSHDYKLILLGGTVAIVWYALLDAFVVSGRRIHLLQIGVVGLLMLFLTRSYAVLPAVLGNKYPFLVALELVIVWALFTSRSIIASNDEPSRTAVGREERPIAQLRATR